MRRVGPDTSVGANQTHYGFFGLFRFGCGPNGDVFGLQKRPGVPWVCETQLVVLPEGLRLTAGAIRARAVQWSGGVVIESREGAPRPTLVLFFVRTAPGDFTSQSGTGA